MSMKFIEKVNIEVLKEIVKKVNSVPTSDGSSTLGDTENSYQLQCKYALKHYLSILNEKGEVTVTYEQNKKLKTRFVCKNGIGLQLLPRKVRSHVSGEFFDDYDIKGCHHAILKNLFLRMGLTVPATLSLYLEDKKEFEKVYGLNKNDMIKIINKEDLNKGKKFQELKEFHTLIYKDLLFDLKDKEKNLIKKIDNYLTEQNKDYNRSGKIISHFLQHEENKILQAMIGYIKENHKDIKIGVLCYDGLMLYKNEKNNDELLRNLEQAVKQNTKYDIQLVKKEFDYSWDYKKAPEDIDDDENTDINNLNDEQAFQLFQEFYDKKIITDVELNIYLINEFGIWKTVKKTNKSIQTMIFDFNRYLISKHYIYNLKNRNSRENFLSGLITYLQVENLQFNVDEYLLPFKNGVIELKTGVFRNAKPEEYIIQYINYDYVKTTTSNIDHFFNQLFDNIEIKVYFINSLSFCLENLNREQVIIFMIGVLARNGKSTLLELMSLAMDLFGARISTNLITGKREESNNANEALMALKGKRFSYCSEPEKGKKININIIKELTGDVVSVRENYGKQEEFKVNATIFVCSQYPPELDDVDAGIKRRVRLVPFENRFEENPIKANERQLKIFTIEDKEMLKIELINLLINTYVKLCNNNYKYSTPDIVKSGTQDYFEDNNTIDNFIYERFEFCEGSQLKLQEVNEHFSSKRISCNPSMLKHKLKQLLNVDYYKDKTINKVRYFLEFKDLKVKDNY